MNFYIKLAYKNLFRHKLRTAVSVSAVVVGVMVVVFARGYVEGITSSTTESYIHYRTGHIRITDSEYPKKERTLSLIYPVDGFTRDDSGIEGMIDRIEKIKGVNMALPRIKFGAMTTTDDELIDMAGWGVDPKKEIEFTRIENMIVKGRMVNKGAREVVMGSALLNKLGVDVGEKITLVYNTSFGSMGGTTFKVTGRILSDLKMLNEKIFYLPIDVAGKLLYMEGQATELLIDTQSVDNVKKVVPRIKSLFTDFDPQNRYTVIPWTESGGMVEWIQMARTIYGFIYIFILALASFVVVNTMIMVVAERTREIGIMGALGMGHRRIMGVFISEGLLKGGIGSFIGAALGGVITWIVSRTGINFGDALAGMEEEVLLGTVIYPYFSVENMIFGFLLGIIIVTAACYIPARKAALLNPNEALSRN